MSTLPDAERAATFLDALCHSIESYWSRRATAESRTYAAQAIGLLAANAAAYLRGDEMAASAVMVASNFAGRAINLTTTTAAHAMCYQLTALYGLRHGHAAAVCLPAAWERLLAASAEDAALAQTLAELARLLALRTAAALDDGWLPADEGDLALLAGSVNAQRLGNYPVALAEDDLYEMYRRALWGWR